MKLLDSDIKTKEILEWKGIHLPELEEHTL